MAEVPNGDEMEVLTGRFPEWAATIDFDFENPKASSVVVEIDIDKVVLRLISLKSQFLGQQWFDARGGSVDLNRFRVFSRACRV